ncbi:MAG: methyltransferase domain-containing protein [Deltaproteobacteria bacterium]|nr:methyltransferase domain-containing protein [Deltaproteobacteria bacterium]MBW2445980.1 methyltransferase domain-containing protein [Deltaproteobacteria bacterium]
MAASDSSPTSPEDRDAHFRQLERQWQEDVGQHLLDIPHEMPGSAAVFERQFQRVIDHLDLGRPGVIAEVGCGKGHFLDQVARTAGDGGPQVVGIDLSHAVHALPAKGLDGLQADGEALPFADGSLRVMVYDGALHHLIDYRAALHDAHRTLAPGGRFVIFEPVSSPFTRLVHRLLDPIIFKQVEYESPIDQEYKHAFLEAPVLEALDELGMTWTLERTDALAYPMTGCYAGSVFARSLPFMRFVMAAEGVCERVPLVRNLLAVLAWRFLVVATKPAK